MRKIISIGVLSILSVGCADFPQIPRSLAPMVNSAKVIDLKFEGDFTGTSDEWQLLSQTTGSQFNFDRSTYLNVDSIIFKASLRSEQQNVRCVVDVYNLTDNAHIEGSTMLSRIRYELHSVRSGNIKYEFPNKKVLLGVRVKSEQRNNHIEARHFSLLIYYH